MMEAKPALSYVREWHELYKDELIEKFEFLIKEERRKEALNLWDVLEAHWTYDRVNKE